VTSERNINRALLALGALLVLGALVAIPFRGTGARDGVADGGPEASAASVDKVEIKGFKYMPPNATVKAGTKLAFTNGDTAPHTATVKQEGGFDTGSLKKGQRRAVMLDRPGTYEYFCQFHAFMKGKVTVE
jgi:plastocyanin